MPRDNVKATKLKVRLPFGLGEIEFENDESQQRAAWSLYVELSTRISTQKLNEDEGLLREALSSLYVLFERTRSILHNAGPEIANGPRSLGPIAIEILNRGLRPFLAKWHPLLTAHEHSKPASISNYEHERKWLKSVELRKELREVQAQMELYVVALAQIAGID